MGNVRRPTSVFLSYGHDDQRVARLLERDLRRLGRPVFGTARIRVIRDQLSLRPSNDLWSSIQQQLDLSDQLVLLASPASAASEWVTRELSHFVGRAGTQKIVLVVVGGELRWDNTASAFAGDQTTALAAALATHYTAEPLYVDLRWAARAPQADSDPRWRAALLDIASAVTGLDKESVAAEDAVARRKALRLAWSAASALAVLATAATIFGVFAYIFGNRAEARLRAGQAHVGQLLTVVDGELTKLRAAGVARRALLDQSRTLLDRLGAPDSAAAARTGRVLDVLQWSSSAAEATQAGDARTALAQHARAVQVARDLANMPDASSRMAAAIALADAGTTSFVFGDLGRAADLLEQARAIRERMYTEHADAARAFDLATVIDRLGRVRFRQGQLDEARRLHGRGKQLVAGLPSSDARRLALAESELLLFDVAAAKGEDSIVEYLARANTNLDAVVDQSRLDVTRRRLDLDMRMEQFVDPQDICPRITAAAVDLFASEGDADDAARFADAIAVCPGYDDKLIARTSALRKELERSSEQAPRLLALLIAVEGHASAQHGDAANAKRLLLDATGRFENLLAAQPSDEALQSALARGYSYLMNLPASVTDVHRWKDRCLQVSRGSVGARRRIDCVIASTPALLVPAANDQAPAVALLGELTQALHDAETLDDGSPSARLRRFQVVRLCAVAARWARDQASVSAYLDQASTLVLDQEKRAPDAPATNFMRNALEQTKAQSAPLPPTR